MNVSNRNLALAVRATIEQALSRFNLPDSEAAVRLLLMISAHESGMFSFCRQVRGPALGLFQMEPATYEFCIEYLSRTGKFPTVARKCMPARLVTDSVLAAAMARVYLFSKPEPLPEADDLQGLAVYAKRHWNTEAGAATVDDYLKAYMEAWGAAEGSAA